VKRPLDASSYFNGRAGIYRCRYAALSALDGVLDATCTAKRDIGSSIVAANNDNSQNNGCGQ
jgi:hypothetical protein